MRETLAQKWQPWISWGNPSDEATEYDKFQTLSEVEFSTREAEIVVKNPILKNMTIIKQAMTKTTTNFSPVIRHETRSKRMSTIARHETQEIAHISKIKGARGSGSQSPLQK